MLIGFLGIIFTIFLNSNLDVYYKIIIVIEMLVIFFAGFFIGNRYRRKIGK